MSVKFNYFVPIIFQEFVKICSRIFTSKDPGIIFFAPRTDRIKRVEQLIENSRQEIAIIKIQLTPQEINDIEDLDIVLTNALKFIKKRNKVGVFIANTELLITERKYFLIDYLVKKQETSPNIRFIFLSEIDLTHPEIAKNLLTTSLFSNIFYYPLYGLNDSIKFINYLQNKWNYKLKQSVKKEIVNQCGGQFWLIKQTARLVKDNPELKIEEIFNKDEIQAPLDIIYSSFLESERTVIKKIIQNKHLSTHIEEHSFSYLKKIKLIVNNKISIPLLVNYIQKKIQKVDIKLIGRIISINDLTVNNYFSKKEIRALRIMLEKRDELVSRDGLAKELWPANTEESYSDWAVDRIISRLKVKINQLGLPKEIIKTIRGKGYIFES